jgi:LysR family tcuABC transcriptional regulator
VPGRDNVRRRNLETYFQTHGVRADAMLELDALIGTLELVARSDWVTVLPSLISVNDIGRGELAVNPIDPPMHAEFVMIQPSRRILSTPARLFLNRFKAEVTQIQERWTQVLAARRGDARDRPAAGARLSPAYRMGGHKPALGGAEGATRVPRSHKVRTSGDYKTHHR